MKVLIIEDSPSMANVYKIIIQDKAPSAEIFITESCKDFITKGLREIDYTLVFSDWLLGRNETAEPILKLLNGNAKNLYIITGYPTEKRLVNFVKRGTVKRVINKMDFNIKDGLAIVEGLMGEPINA